MCLLVAYVKDIIQYCCPKMDNIETFIDKVVENKIIHRMTSNSASHFLSASAAAAAEPHP